MFPSKLPCIGGEWTPHHFGKNPGIISSWLFYIYIMIIFPLYRLYNHSVHPHGWPPGIGERRVPRWPSVQWWVHVRRERSGNPHCPCCKSGEEKPSPASLQSVAILRYPNVLGDQQSIIYQKIHSLVQEQYWYTGCLWLWGKPFAAVAQVTGNKPWANAKFSNQFLPKDRNDQNAGNTKNDGRDGINMK